MSFFADSEHSVGFCALDAKPPVWHMLAMISVEIAKADFHQRATLQNLLQLYTHDFSDNWAGTDRGDVDQQGRFPPYPLDDYWDAPPYAALLFRIGGHICGFALMNDRSHLGLEVDRNVAEFFVLRKYRNVGIGMAAAHALFSRHPGAWEVAVARKNVSALRFWRQAINGYNPAERLTETDIVSADWNGPVLRFHVTA
jgi:predicted acetyltransferase